MPGNNANQNLKEEGNQPKRKATGFPGMNIPEGKAPRSEEEVADARQRNVEHGKKKGASKEAKRPL